MSESIEQGQGAGPANPRPRKNAELFWRMVAGLMLVVIAWVIWVLYQISPRSVVTPLAYELRTTSANAPSSAASAAASAQASAAPPAFSPLNQIAPDAAATLAMERAQAAARSGAHQASADVQAATVETREEAVQGERLKLATEITTPLVERKWTPQQQDGKSDGAFPAATDVKGKTRP